VQRRGAATLRAGLQIYLPLQRHGVNSGSSGDPSTLQILRASTSVSVLSPAALSLLVPEYAGAYRSWSANKRTPAGVLVPICVACRSRRRCCTNAHTAAPLHSRLSPAAMRTSLASVLHLTLQTAPTPRLPLVSWPPDNHAVATPNFAVTPTAEHPRGSGSPDSVTQQPGSHGCIYSLDCWCQQASTSVYASLMKSCVLAGVGYHKLYRPPSAMRLYVIHCGLRMAASA